MKEGPLLKEERALKKRNAISQKMRDSVNETEYIFILELVKQNHFVASRRKTTLLLLYVTFKFQMGYQELLDNNSFNQKRQ